MGYTPVQQELFKLGQQASRVLSATLARPRPHYVIGNAAYQQGRPCHRDFLRWVADCKGRQITENEAETPHITAEEWAEIRTYEAVFFINSGQVFAN